MVKRLTILDPVRATVAVAETVGLLIACIAAALVWWTPWVVVPAIIVIASRQQACFVLAHDAAHYRLYGTRWLNDLVGRAVATVVGISMRTYRSSTACTTIIFTRPRTRISPSTAATRGVAPTCCASWRRT